MLATRLGVGHKAVFLNGFQRGHRGGRSERIARKGGAVGAWGEQCGKLGAEGDHATHRETACNALGEGYDIRNHSAREILTLEREPGSGTPDTRLDLIDDEQRVVVVAHLTGLLHIAGPKRTHASLTLDQFHDDGGDRSLAVFAETGFGKRVMQCGLVTSFDEFDIGNQRLERFSDGGLPRCGQRAHGTPMEAVGHGDDTCRLPANGRRCARQGASIQFGKLQCRLVAFRSGVAEIHMRSLGSVRKLNELRRQFDLRLRGEVVAHMGGFGGLLADGLHPFRVGVAECVHRDARKEVEVFIAIDVPDMRAFSVVHNAKRRAEHVHVHSGVLPQPLGVLTAEVFQLFSCHTSSSFQYRLRERPWFQCHLW